VTTFNFPPPSRYFGVPTVTYVGPDGEAVVHLARRFAPAPERFATIGWHTVVEGERMDLVAALALGDPEAFWRICDANAAMRPDDLTATVGRRLRIALAEGLPAPSAAV
jgi:hypothetical protein